MDEWMILVGEIRVGVANTKERAHEEETIICWCIESERAESEREKLQCDAVTTHLCTVIQKYED